MFQIREHLINLEKISYIKDDQLNQTEKNGYLDCSLGINPFGCSKLINEKTDLLRYIENINHYPNYPYAQLRKEISNYWADVADIDPNYIKLGSGSMNILSIVNKLLIDKGTRVLGYCPQFSEYIGDVLNSGGIYESVDLRIDNNYKFNVEDFIDRMNSKYQIVYIDNPNNPTGQIIALSDIIRILDKASAINQCVIIDEAYGDFMNKEESAISLIGKYPNLIVTRTFSKGFGLAGIRVGYMLSNQQIQKFYSKVEVPFTVNSIGEHFASLALHDAEFLQESINKIRTRKQLILQACKQLKVLETSLNVPIFVIMHPDENIDLKNIFFEKHILTESGDDFINLGQNAVRIVTPVKIEGFLRAIEEIEMKI